MVLSAGKCHFTCLGKNTENETFIFKVTIDNRLTISSHIRESCKKASQKISALSRISNQLHDSEKNFSLNAVIKSQFSYCPLVWIVYSSTSNIMIAKVHERLLG